MRILTISDVVIDALQGLALTHITQGVELILACGDLPADYLEYLVSMLNVPLFYVMGNHGGDGGERVFPEGCENIDTRAVEYKGLLIAGLEGSLRYNSRPNFQYTENEMRGKIAKLTPALVLNRARYGRYLDILVTHAPPFQIGDGVDLPHRGFKSFVWLIDNYKPRYHLHGHVHIYDNRAETMHERGATKIINTYGYKIFDVPVLSQTKKK